MGSASSGNQSASSANWNTEAASSIDTKDLSILQDEMYSEALLFKKCTVYAGYFNDPALKRMAENAAGHHRRHFDTLHGYLNGSYCRSDSREAYQNACGDARQRFLPCV